MTGTTSLDRDVVLEREVHRRLVDLPVETLDERGRRALITDLVHDADPVVGGDALRRMVDRVLARVLGLGPLEPLLADPSVSEIMVNGPGPVWVERRGGVELTDVVVDDDAIGHIVERIVTPLGRRVDRASPLLDARLADGSRVNVILAPLAVDGTCITIRRFGIAQVALEDVASAGTAALLRWAVRSRANVVVSGGTGAGKTTLLNGLATEIPTRERIVTIEDAAELQLAAPHVVRLEARPPTADGVGRVSIRDLVRNALRMRPDRIVVGEVRGAEALDMVQAMNTGHEGSLSTCHANSPADALRRLETMVLQADVPLPLAAVRDQLESAIDFVVQVERGPAGVRSVTSVGEVSGGGTDPRIRELADRRGLRSLPARPGRLPGGARASSAWVES